MTRRSAEAEYRAINEDACELIWINRLLVEDLSIPIQGPLKLFSDSNSAKCLVHNPIEHDRMNHGRIDRNFIKSEIENGSFPEHYIPTKLGEADVLTKALLISKRLMLACWE